MKQQRILRIGSRDSHLAVRQTTIVMDALQAAYPNWNLELVTMKTTGDKILDRRLDQIGGKGLFVKELDAALLEGRVDLTVHSMKDLPMETNPELPIATLFRRGNSRDCLVLREGCSEVSVIGTSSARRQVQLSRLYPNAIVESVRGNIHTRLKKLDDGQFSALILAAAGLERAGLTHRISRYFSPEEMIPAAGQGILAVQGRRGEDFSFLEGFQDADGTYAALAERAFVKYLNGGCSSPVAAHAVVEEEKMTLLGLYYEEETGNYQKGRMTGKKEDAESLGIALARKLRETCQGRKEEQAE